MALHKRGPKLELHKRGPKLESCAQARRGKHDVTSDPIGNRCGAGADDLRDCRLRGIDLLTA